MDTGRFWSLILVVVSAWGLLVTASKTKGDVYRQLGNLRNYVKDQIFNVRGEIGQLSDKINYLKADLDQIKEDDAIGYDLDIPAGGENGPVKANMIVKGFHQQRHFNRKIIDRMEKLENNMVDNTKKISEEMADLVKKVEENYTALSEQLIQLEKKVLAMGGGPDAKEDCTNLSGVNAIYVDTMKSSVKVFCDDETAGGDWIVFMRRMDGSQDFNKSWSEYKFGFGDPAGEFWLGNEFLHHFTTNKRVELRIDMVDFFGNRAHVQYGEFRVDSEKDRYKLHVSDYSGNSGDSLILLANPSFTHNGMKFSTFDSDNDLTRTSCASTFSSGWWFNKCFTANLNGVYSRVPYIRHHNGIIWYSWSGFGQALKFVEMKTKVIF